MAQLKSIVIGKNLNIAEKLREQINDLKGGPIKGALTLPSSEFKYWWYLEFGTATRYRPSDAEGLRRPTGIPADQGTSSYYPIAARRKKLLVFRLYGGLIRTKVVQHPGIRPANAGKGIVRVAIRKMQIDIANELKKIVKSRKGKLPTRKMLVKLVNAHLVQMLTSIRRRTPEDPDPEFEHSDDPRHSYHLRDAWSVTLAE